MMRAKPILLLLAILVLPATLAVGAVQAQQPANLVDSGPTAALGTSFIYQGRLKDGSGSPIDDTCSLTLSLWDAEDAGSQVGGNSVVTDVAVADGYFATRVNSGGEFGANAFTGQARWLEIAVQCTGDANPITLSPRQPLSAAPQALYALSTGALRGYQVRATAPADGQVLKWDGSAWTPGTDETGGGSGEGDITAVYAGDGLTGGGESGAVTLHADFAGSGSATTVSRSDHDHWGQSWSGSYFGLYLSGGEVGLEAHGSSRGVWGESSATDGRAVYGSASATSGTSYGVYGQSSSTDGRGVYGRALTGGGVTAGVHGTANSYDGYGVYGEAPNNGVYGYASSTLGRGVYGEGARYGVYGLSGAASGTTYGIYGQANSTYGMGVYGYAGADTGYTYGVNGEVDSPDGRGVRGSNSATSGNAIGVSGTTASTAGYGVYGLAGASNGANYGVYGRSDSTEGYGVYGQGGSGTGTTYGIYGRSSADQGHGVHGYASDVTGNTTGVYGEAVSTVGTGVYGLASTTYGAGYGVYGRSVSANGGYGVYGYAAGTSGYGVYGWATASTGTNYGVYGRTESSNGYAGYFYGRIHARAVINSTATPDNHVAQIYNTSTGSSPDVLALKVGYTSNPGTEINFITFFNGNNAAFGAVEGSGSGGVTFKSGSGDYAEFLPRLDPREEMAPGDVVGVWDGTVSKATRGAGQVLVVSSGPIVLGNDPGEGNEADYEKVAFLGQVQVKVRGPVAAGDFLVPSGLEDGSAAAVAPEAITAEEFTQVVGQAWASSGDPGVKTVLAVVGRVQHDPTVARMASRIQALEDSVGRLEARLAALEGAGPGEPDPASFPLSTLLPGAGILLAGIAGGWLFRRRGGAR